MAIVKINNIEYNCSNYECTTKNLKLIDVVTEDGITSMEFGNINWDIVELPTVPEPTLEERVETNEDALDELIQYVYGGA